MKSTDSRKGKGMIRRRPVIDIMDLPLYGTMDGSWILSDRTIEYTTGDRIENYDGTPLAIHEGVKH